MYNGTYRIALTNALGASDPALPNTFQLQVFSSGSSALTPLETWTVSLKHQLDGYGRQQYIEDVINGNSNYIRVAVNTLNNFDLLPASMVTSTMMYLTGSNSALAYLSDGDSGLSGITANQLPVIINGLDGFPTGISSAYSSTKNSGWQLYLNNEQAKFQLLLNAGYTFPSVQLQMLDVCANRGNCMAILDIPFSAQGNKYDRTTDPINYRNNPYGGLNADTSFGALYSPWYLINDQYSGKQVWVPPSGFVAAIYCATDINFATWFSPAGLKRGLVDVVMLGHTTTSRIVTCLLPTRFVLLAYLKTSV